MLELLTPLRESLNKSALSDLSNWFSDIPENVSWYVISDYCFGDRTKKNDTVSFTILLHHDKIENIKEYIHHFAPKDIKSTRTISREFLQYINSPVVFTFTFVIDRKSNLLRDYATDENMLSFLSPFRGVVSDIAANSTFEAGYIEAVLKRSRAFETDFQKKSFNSKLSRQIYLVSAFASLVFEFLSITKKPEYIQWISDRDALAERFDGFVYDLSFFLFLTGYSKQISPNKESLTILDKPKFIFTEPEKSGKNFFDELIRIPDYLAGTLADLDIEANTFSKDKYNTVLMESMVNSTNHVVLNISGSGSELSCRRLVQKT
jgi:hypothetical protein